jgi:hypothetical protein
MKNKTYRFFYHYFKQKDMWSVHFKNQCLVVEDIKCQIPCESKKNKRQPRRVMQGFATDVKIKNNIAYIT